MILRIFYLKVSGLLSKGLPGLSERLHFHPFYALHSIETKWAMRSGPLYRPSYKRIIIDITNLCNLNCIDCNRSCGQGQAMADEHMSLSQIEKFVKESVDQGKKWKEILLEGGEPTLHPRFFDIIDVLMRYKRGFSPWTNIKVITNGYGEKVNRVLSSLSATEVDVYNSRKSSISQESHCAFNVAPFDLDEFSQFDFSQGCYLPVFYGLGLTRYGYYPHPICGSIDRVFGFDLGRKKLPDADDSMEDHFRKFCGLCGFFRFNILKKKTKNVADIENNLRGRLSPTWKKVYAEYAKERPKLTLY